MIVVAGIRVGPVAPAGTRVGCAATYPKPMLPVILAGKVEELLTG